MAAAEHLRQAIGELDDADAATRRRARVRARR